MNDFSHAAAQASAIRHPTVSIVIPLKDEAESIAPLVGKIISVTDDAQISLADIVLVDDGSEDDTWAVAERLCREHAQIHAIRVRRNIGKAAALMIGVEAATGDIIITMDGDLQDDPAEIPQFVALIAAGNDLVSGWKRKRNDPLSKTLPSRLFNRVTARMSGVKLHDFNCGFKAYRREIFDSVQLYGELHRYVPVLAHALGFRIAELPVRHHARRFGKSKYGFQRFARGFLDLLTVMMITRYAYRPSHLFGGLGVVLFLAGTLILVYLAGLKIFTGAEIGGRPLLSLGVLLDVIGLQILLFGMLAELIISRSPRPVKLDAFVAQKIAGRGTSQ